MQSNPITRRVAKLSNQWHEFASNPRARLLCWRLASDEQRMLDGFFALELDERTAEHSELFVPLESAFESAEAHGAVLRDELVAHYQADQEGLRAEGVAADWQAPEARDSEPGLDLFIRTCLSFATHHQLTGHMVLVLTPRSVGSPKLYEAWLLQLAGAAPEKLRIVVLDIPGTPAPEGLFEDRGERVVVRKAELDMRAAFFEVSESASHRAAPGTRFRELFLQLGAALGESKLDSALQLGAAAIALAATQKWFHLAVPVHAALGQSLGAEGRTDEARAQYVAAEQSALRGQTEGAPPEREGCKKLRLQSRFGLGSVLMAGKEYPEAAQVFAETIPIAADSGEDGMRLDCYRLAALCHELAEAPKESFRWAYDGLVEARKMSADTLATSSLPYLGDALLRLCEPAERESFRSEIERELEQLTGKPDWRPAAP